jgi:hypothetical protein
MATAAATTQKSVKSFDVALLENELDVRSEALNEERVSLFASLIEADVVLPPIEIYNREGKNFVKDGRTRLEAFRRLGRKTIPGVEVPYTTKTQMLIEALASNMTKKGAPLPPTEADFARVIRSLAKEGVMKPDAVRMFESIGVPYAFAKQLVNRTYHSKRKLDELHALESIGRGLSIVEASTMYNVPVATIKRKLAEKGDYGLANFGLDSAKKLKAFRQFVSDKVRVLRSRSDGLANEAIKVILRRDILELQRWVDAQEVATR